MKSQLTKLTLTITALAVLSSCSGEAPESNKTDAAPEPQSQQNAAPPTTEAKPKPKPAKKGENYGTLKLKFGDEAVEVTTFKKLGTELIPAGPGAGIRLSGTDDEVFSVTYQVKEGESATGEFAPVTDPQEGKRGASVSVMDFLKAERMVSLKSGSITVTKCADGNFSATFEGEGHPGNVPFSGSIDVKIQ